MSVRRVVAGMAILIAFAGTGAVAIAQTQSLEEDSREAALGLDTSREYPESFLNTAEKYEAKAPEGTEPGKPISDDEVHVPAGGVPVWFVTSCNEAAAKDKTLDSDPLCRAVLLKDAGLIEAGVLKIADVEETYDEWIRGK